MGNDKKFAHHLPASVVDTCRQGFISNSARFTEIPFARPCKTRAVLAGLMGVSCVYYVVVVVCARESPRSPLLGVDSLQ
jgi:hypothetical protein